MVIDLHEKIPELLNTVTEATEENAMGINKLFLLMLENKHVIRASRDTFKKIRDFKFLNKANKDLITFILNHYVNTYSSLPPISKTILIVPSKDYDTKNDNEYCIVLKDAYNLDCAILSTENPTDYSFYMNVFDYLNNNNEYTIRLDNHAFGGGSAKDFLSAMDKENNIVLAISDSDKSYENDSYGDTANKVIEFIDSHTGTSIMDYYIIQMREKENLMPIDCYCLFGKAFHKLLFDCINKFASNSEFMRYIDLKDGYRLKNINTSDTEWHRLYDDFIDECRHSGIYNMDASKDNDVCICGIGRQLADELNSIFFCKSYVKTFQQNKKIEAAKFDIKEHIPSYIMDEYNIIYSLLFTFGCAYKKRHISFVKKEC